MNTPSIQGSPAPQPPALPNFDDVAPKGDSFAKYLVDSIEEVNAMQVQADQAVEQLATGQEVNPAEVLTAIQKADIAFRMMMQVRNKLIQAYQEVRDIRI